MARPQLTWKGTLLRRLVRSSSAAMASVSHRLEGLSQMSGSPFDPANHNPSVSRPSLGYPLSSRFEPTLDRFHEPLTTAVVLSRNPDQSRQVLVQFTQILDGYTLVDAPGSELLLNADMYALSFRNPSKPTYTLCRFETGPVPFPISDNWNTWWAQPTTSGQPAVRAVNPPGRHCDYLGFQPSRQLGIGPMP
jgi:hypothetical protein